MTTADETIREQLSAWMDGELAPDEARFLERRLAGDADLRRQFERLQLAATCLRGQAWRPMPASLASGIDLALAGAYPSVAIRTRHPSRWMVAASLGVLALLIAPGLWREQSAVPTVTTASRPATNLLPSPASADLVAAAPARVSSNPVPAGAPALAVRDEPVFISVVDTARAESPMPLESQSPEDFPLVESALQASWPRSPLATRDDPALEAYLVRHNQMLADDPLGGFVPYVDVMAGDKQSDPASDEAFDAAGAGGR